MAIAEWDIPGAFVFVRCHGLNVFSSEHMFDV